MKILKVIKNIVIDILIVILLGLIVFNFLNKTKPVPIFNYYLLTVKTGSMMNALNIGDNIIVKKVDDYKVGDIITYKKDDIYVTHRITKIDGNTVTTKGDANNTEDPSFNRKKVLGKFVYKSDLLNFIIKYRLIIVLVVIVLYLINSIIKTKIRR